MRRVLVTAVLLAAARPAAADHVTVTVVEVAGGVGYLDKGSKDGVVRGTRITFGGNVLVVVEVTATTAVVELGALSLAPGAKGTAVVTPGRTDLVVLPKPRPPDAFREQWPAAVLPATAQAPARVPLGGKPRGGASVTVIGHAFAVADRTRTEASAEARVIASFDVMTERPLAADVDVAARVYRAGANSDERVPVFVRAAQLRYGDASDPRFALGRLRYAASSIGMLDGVRASVRRSSVTVSAFGGIVPDPINGKPDPSASRFGAEAVVDDPRSAWRPRLALTTYGSTWEGKLDEQRVVLAGSANHAALWLDGWAEAQAFSSDNPWGARAVEVTGAGGTAAWRSRGRYLAADVTYLRPERSLRLAAALPPAWLCTRAPQVGDVATEACDGGDSWASGSAAAGVRTARWSLDAIGAIGRTHGVAIAYDASGYVGGEVRFGPQRTFANVSVGQASFARWTAGQLGVGLVLSRRLDVAVSYRPELLDYVAATEPMLLHHAGLDMHVAVRRDLDLALSALGTTGADRDVLAVLSTIVWRPL